MREGAAEILRSSFLLCKFLQGGGSSTVVLKYVTVIVLKSEKTNGC